MYKFNIILSVLLIYSINIFAQFPNKQITTNSYDQSETAIAVNPTNSNNLISVWNDLSDYPNPSSYVRPGYAISNDGGNSWQYNIVPVPSYGYGFDPSVSFNSSGNAFYAYTASAGVKDANYQYLTGPVSLSFTTDGGISWNYKQVSSKTYLQDKPYMAIDNTGGANDGNIYVSWSDFTNGSAIDFAFSSDNGQSFATSVLDRVTNVVSSIVSLAPVLGPGNGSASGEFVQASVPVVAPNGDIYVVWLHANDSITGSTGDLKISRIIVSNGSANIQYTKTIVSNFHIVYHSRLGRFQVGSLPTITIDHNNNIYVAYTQFNYLDNYKIYYTVSSDYGQNWSTPASVSDISVSSYQYFPWLSSSSEGTISLVYYDGNSTSADVYLSELYPGSSNFSSPTKLTSTSITLQSTGLTSDYIGIASANGNNVYPVWVDVKNPENQDVYATLYNSSVKLAYSNQSLSSTATLNNNQRKIIKDGSGNYHIIYESGGETMYRYSTNGGYDWSSPQIISDYSGKNSSSSITSSGSNIIACWQEQDGSTYNVSYARSTNNGSTWSSPFILYSGLTTEPNPVIDEAFNQIYIIYSTSSGLASIYSNNSGVSWSSPTTVPGTSSSSSNPSLTTNSVGWLFLSYDDGQTIKAAYNSGSGWANYFNAISDNSRTDINTFGSVSGDSDGLTHFVWQGHDHVYNMDVICYRNIDYQSMSLSPVTEFAYYYTPYRPSVMGHLDSGGGATVLFYDNNNNVHQVENNGISWDAGWGTPTQVVASNGTYPSIIEKADSLQESYIWSDISGAPYAVHYYLRGTGALGKSYANENQETIHYHRSLELRDTLTNSLFALDFGDFSLHQDNGYSRSIALTPLSNSLQYSSMNLESLFSTLKTNSVKMGSGRDTLTFQYSTHLNNLQNLCENKNRPIKVSLYGVANGKKYSLWHIHLLTNPASDKNQVKSTVNIPIPSYLSEDDLSFYIDVSNVLTSSKHLSYSLTNIYLDPQSDASYLKKSSSMVESSSNMEKPGGYNISQNYPNPFNPTTKISYQLPSKGIVSLKVYDILGRIVATLASGLKEAGYYTTEFNGSYLSSGVYIYRLSVKALDGSNEYTAIKKLTLLK